MSVGSFSQVITPIQLNGYKFFAIGDVSNLNHNLLGLFCSKKCPGEVILKSFDTAKQLKEKDLVVVSGFHSPIEKDIFEILLRGSKPIVMGLARNINNYHIPSKLLPLVENKRITIIAPVLNSNENRITVSTSNQRNELILNICNEVLLLHTQPGGHLDQSYRKFLSEGKRIFSIDSDKNKHLFNTGVLKWV